MVRDIELNELRSLEWVVNGTSCCLLLLSEASQESEEGRKWGKRKVQREQSLCSREIVSKPGSVLSFEERQCPGLRQVDRKLGQIPAGSENRFGQETRQPWTGLHLWCLQELGQALPTLPDHPLRSARSWVSLNQPGPWMFCLLCHSALSLLLPPLLLI